MIYALRPQHEPVLQVSSHLPYRHARPGDRKQHVSTVHRVRRCRHSLLPLNWVMVLSSGRQYSRPSSCSLQPSGRHWANLRNSLNSHQP